MWLLSACEWLRTMVNLSLIFAQRWQCSVKITPGVFVTIATKTPGVIFTEHCQRCAKINDKFTIVRSHSHADNSHMTGYHYVMTGRRAPFADGEHPIPTNELYPSLGSVVS